jgi:hypothetical protein
MLSGLTDVAIVLPLFAMPCQMVRSLLEHWFVEKQFETWSAASVHVLGNSGAHRPNTQLSDKRAHAIAPNVLANTPSQNPSPLLHALKTVLWSAFNAFETTACEYVLLLSIVPLPDMY